MSRTWLGRMFGGVSRVTVGPNAIVLVVAWVWPAAWASIHAAEDIGPVEAAMDPGRRTGPRGARAGVGCRRGRVGVGVDAQQDAPASGEVDHRGRIIVRSLLRLPPQVTQRPQPRPAEDAGHRGARGGDIAAGEDAGIDAGQQQAGE